MRKLINLNLDEAEAVINIYRKYINYLPLHRGEENYDIRYDFPEGRAIISIAVMPKFYDITVKPETSILSMQKPLIPSFNIGISMNSSQKMVWHKTPKNKDAMIWLSTKHGNSSRAEHLLMLCTVCEIIWSQFMFALDVRQYGDTIEYKFRKDYKTFAEEYINQRIIDANKKKLLDGWDTVALTRKQLIKVGEILSTNKIQHDFDNFALTRFCFAMYDDVRKETDYYYFNKQGSTLNCAICNKADYSINWFKVKTSLPFEHDGEMTIDLHLDVENKGLEEYLLQRTEDLPYWEWIVNSFYAINTFMLHYGDVSMEIEEKQAIAPTENRSQKHKKPERNVSRIFKSYKLVKNWSTKARKKAEFTCEAWGVRGHYRHYKNGKVIFVEAYVKGKEKDKYKGKEYALLPYKDA